MLVDVVLIDVVELDDSLLLEAAVVRSLLGLAFKLIIDHGVYAGRILFVI